MILVPLGPAQRKEEEGRGRNKTTPPTTHIRGQHQHCTSTTPTRGRKKERGQTRYLKTQRERDTKRETERDRKRETERERKTVRDRERQRQKERSSSTWG